MIYCQACLPVTKWHTNLTNTSSYFTPSQPNRMSTDSTNPRYSHSWKSEKHSPCFHWLGQLGHTTLDRDVVGNRVKKIGWNGDLAAWQARSPKPVNLKKPSNLITSHHICFISFILFSIFLLLFISFWWQLIHAFKGISWQNIRIFNRPKSSKISTYPRARSEEESKQARLNHFDVLQPFPIMSHPVPRIVEISITCGVHDIWIKDQKVYIHLGKDLWSSSLLRRYYSYYRICSYSHQALHLFLTLREQLRQANLQPVLPWTCQVKLKQFCNEYRKKDCNWETNQSS